MKIATFNVNSIRSRVELITTWLRDKNPIDILCMQEIKCENEQFPTQTFEKEKYFVAVNGQKRYNGVAICSKLPFDSIKIKFDDPILDLQKRMIEVHVEDLVIINVYVPHGSSDETDEKYIFKMKFYDALTSYVNELKNRYKKIVLVGDFNVALTDIDVYNPRLFQGKVGFLKSEKRKLKTLLDVGLHDCFREKYPSLKAYTWWDYRTAGIWRDEGMRIDYMLATDEAFKECKEIGVDIWTRKRKSPTPSDHAPLIGEI